MGTAENLLRKQYLIAPRQIEKLDILSKQENKSAAAIVREAIDAYNPDELAMLEHSDLLDFALKSIHDATELTKQTRLKVEKVIRESSQYE